MLRGFQYHNRTYELLSSLPESEGLENIITRVAHVDFEEEKTLKTFIYRFVGNIMFW